MMKNLHEPEWFSVNRKIKPKVNICCCYKYIGREGEYMRTVPVPGCGT